MSTRKDKTKEKISEDTELEDRKDKNNKSSSTKTAKDKGIFWEYR